MAGQFDPKGFSAVAPVAAPTAAPSVAPSPAPTTADTFNPAAFTPVATPTAPPKGQYDPVTNFMAGVIDSTPIPRYVASAKKLALGTQDIAHDIFGTPGISDAGQAQLASDNFDLGALGSAKPLNASQPLDLLGTSLSAASYMTPLGAEDALATGAGGWMKNLIKLSAPFAITSTLGGAISDAGDGKSGAQTLGDAALNYAGSVAGFGILKGMGSAIKATAGAMLKSDLVKSANSAILDFMGHALSLDGRFAQGGEVTAKDAALQTKALEQSYQPLHKKAMDAFADTVQSPTNWDDVWSGIKNKVSGYIKSSYKAKDAIYGDVFKEDFFPGNPEKAGYAKPTYDALEKAAGAARNPSSEVVTDAMGHPNLNEDMSAFMETNKVGEPSEMTSLNQYVDKVADALGDPAKPNHLSMKDFDNLFSSAPPSSNPIENKLIRNVQTSLYDSAKTALQDSPEAEAKGILQKWDEATRAHQNITNTAGSRLASSFRDIGSAQEFVDGMMHTNKGPSTAEQRIIDGMSEQTRAQMSDIIYNNALQRSRSMSANYAKGGEAVEKMLDNWTPTGLISPQHEMILRAYAKGMQGTYDDAANIMKSVVSPEASDVAANDALGAAQGAQEKMGAAKDIEEAMGGKPLYKVNSDGTYDFSGLSKMVDKINNGGEYDSLQKYMGQIEDVQNASPSKIGAIVKGIFGATIFHQHPFIGLSALEGSLTKVFGKDANKVTTADLSKLTTDLIRTGKLSPTGLNGFLAKAIQGDFKAVGGMIAKFASGAINTTTKEIATPSEE